MSRFLITRLSAIGDCILTMPLLCALRDHHPDARIVWVVEKGAAPLLARHPCLDELIVLPKGWLKSPRLVWDTRRRLRRERFDIVLDPQSLTKSALLGALSGARQRLGLAAPAGRELALWLNRTLVQPTRDHLVDVQLELLKPLGIDRAEVDYRLPVDPQAAESIGSFLRSQLGDGETFVVLNPGAGWASRRWLPERYAAVAIHLGRRYGLRSVVAWAGREEEEWARKIAEEATPHAVAAPATSLLELAELLRRARCYVGSDTGPMHLSAAVGTVCVSLHGTTLPHKSGPYGPGHVAVQAYYQAGSSGERRRAENLAMQAISVESVCAACEQLLEQNERRRAG